MTTIVADAAAGVMCADSMWTDGNERGPLRKVHRVRGSLFGLAGDLVTINEWLDAYRAGKVPEEGAPAKGLPNVLVLRLSPSRRLHTWSNADGWIAVPSRWAIGSGGMCARAALACGVSAAQAARIAIEIDARSSGVVRTYRLKDSP